MSTVILLNGASSSGKSSTALALQQIARGPLLHVAMDSFLEMLPPRVLGDPDGLMFVPRPGAALPTTDVVVGPVVERALAGMRRAVAGLADAGNDLVVDEVMFGADAETEYRALLAGHRLLMVGVFAPLAMMEAWERARGDRDLGLARAQVEFVHAARRYDLEIETSDGGPEAAARRIAEAFGI